MSSAVTAEILLNGNMNSNKVVYQSGQLVTKIAKFDRKHAGNYQCSLTHGQTRKKVYSETINIQLEPPIVTVTPKSLKLLHNETATIKCAGSRTGMNYSVIWKNVHGEILQNTTIINKTDFVDFFHLLDPKIYHNTSIICELHIQDYEPISDETKISVKFPPFFPNGMSQSSMALNVTVGQSQEMDCTTSENPAATSIKWYHYKDDKTDDKKLLNVSKKVYKFENFGQKMGGDYVCVIENELGSATKKFNVTALPDQLPVIIDSSSENLDIPDLVDEGSKLEKYVTSSWFPKVG